jgi:hypothetical protein
MIPIGVVSSSMPFSIVPNAPVLSFSFAYGDEGGSVFLLNWTVPADNGSAITEYRLEYSFNGSQFFLQELVSGNEYYIGVYGSTDYFRVFATNANGNSLASNIIAVTG